MLNYKTRLPDLRILMEMRPKHSSCFWKVDQQPWQRDFRIGKFNNPMDVIFYSIKEGTTFHGIQNYDDSSLNLFMTMKQQDIQEKLGLIMQCNNTTGGQDFGGHGKKAVAWACRRVPSVQSLSLHQACTKCALPKRACTTCMRACQCIWVRRFKLVDTSL